MKTTALLASALSLFAVAGLASAKTVKVGVIGPFSGPFATYGQGFKQGVEAWVEQHGSTVGDNDVKFIYRNLNGVDPAKAKSIARSLIVKNKVQYLAGVYFTPNAMAIAPLTKQGRVPLVVFNAATSSITQKSPFIVRTSFTMWQNSVPAAKVAASRGLNKAFIAVSDYGPGIDASKAFSSTLKDEGGEIVGSARMPLETTDFSPVMQRAKQSGANVLFAFLPSGPPTLSFMKAFINNGLKAGGMRIITTGDVLAAPSLSTIGPIAKGALSTYHYSVSHQSPENQKMLETVRKQSNHPENISMTTVAAYDGAHLIYAMIKATGGAQNPSKAIDSVKGTSWVSPRGPVSIDPTSRTIDQNVYLRKLTKSGNGYINKEIKIFSDQPDYGFDRK